MRRYGETRTPWRVLGAWVVAALLLAGHHGAAQDGLRGEGRHLPLRPGKAEYRDTVIEAKRTGIICLLLRVPGEFRGHHT